jgi:hypothetical protein
VLKGNPSEYESEEHGLNRACCSDWKDVGYNATSGMRHIGYTDDNHLGRGSVYLSAIGEIHPSPEILRLFYGKEAPVADNVKHPSHYTDRVPGIECIEVSQHFNFNLGNAIKYIWRSGNKGDVVEDLRKAIQYLEFELKRIGEAESADETAYDYLAELDD